MDPATIPPTTSSPDTHGARRGGPSPVTASWVSAIVLLVALVLGNAALARTVARVDLTEDRLYSLSDASKRVVSQLSDPCSVRVYWGGNVPTTAEPVRRGVEGLLEEYEAASNGKLTVTWVKMDETGKKEADDKGLQEVEFGVFEGNKVTQALSHCGLVITYESQTETIAPLIQSSENKEYDIPAKLEYELTSDLWKMSRATKPVVALVTEARPPQMDFMHRGMGGGDKFTVLAHNQLEPQFGNDLRRSVTLEEPVPADVSVVVLPAPRDLSEKKAFHLEQFLLRGGKVFLLANPVGLEGAMGRGEESKTGLEDWLKSNGVEIAPGVVGDFSPNAQSAVFTRSRELIPFPYWVRVVPEGIDSKNPAVRGFRAIPLYFPSEVVVDEKAQAAAGRTVSTLLTTTSQGYRRESAAGLMNVDSPEGKVLGKHVLMAVVTGKFTSFWKGKPSPDEPPPKPPEAPPAGEPGMGEPAMAGPAMTEPGMTEPAMTEPAMADTAPMDGATPTPAPAPTPAEPAGMSSETPMSEPAMDSAAMDSAAMDAGMDAPPGPKGPEGPEGAKDKKDAKPARLDEGSGTLVVLGDADLVSDEFSSVPRLDQTGGLTAAYNGVNGFPLVGNVVDWLTGNEELMALRTRDFSARKMKEIESDDATKIKWANYLSAPVALLIAGLFVFFVRRYRK